MRKNSILLITLIVLSALAYYLYKNNTSSTLAGKPLSDFSIADTASVNKIIITDHQGIMAKLERIPGQSLWRLNDRLLARKDAVDLLLKTMKQIRVRGNVSEKARDNMMKILVTSGKRVEIFQGGDKPAKIYYVGSPTPDHTGTIMLLEIPGIGRSEEPYITHMEGFTGFLSTRFFTSEMEWRYTGIFEYPELDFNEVQIIHHLQPEQSVEVEYTGGNNIAVRGGYNPINHTFEKTFNSFDSLKIKELLLLFKKVHVESYNTLLKPEAMDSLRNTGPAFTVNLTDRQNQKHGVKLYLKRAAKPQYDEAGNLSPWDMDYLWAQTDADEFALAQLYTFEPILRPLSYYSVK